MKYKLSQWHDVNVKPVHVGVYQVKNNYNTFYSYWDGKKFGWVAPDFCFNPINDAYLNRKRSTIQPTKQIWRGIVK